jgi:hypothetical protein
MRHHSTGGESNVHGAPASSRFSTSATVSGNSDLAHAAHLILPHRYHSAVGDSRLVSSVVLLRMWIKQRIHEIDESENVFVCYLPLL